MTFFVGASMEISSINDAFIVDDKFELVTGVAPTECGASFGSRDVGIFVDGKAVAERIVKALEKAGFDDPSYSEILNDLDD